MIKMPDDKFKPCKSNCSSVEFSDILSETSDLDTIEKPKAKSKDKKKKKKKNKDI